MVVCVWVGWSDVVLRLLWGGSDGLEVRSKWNDWWFGVNSDSLMMGCVCYMNMVVKRWWLYVVFDVLMVMMVWKWRGVRDEDMWLYGDICLFVCNMWMICYRL